MHVVTVGGFLGAGKTSLLRGLARWWGERGLKVLVLENEAGQVGLDNRLLKEFGLKVRLLPGGCACCDLQGVLVDQLKRARDEGLWDVVLLEPSGVASLASLSQTLKRYLPELAPRATAAVVDAGRYTAMSRALPKLLADHLSASSQVVLSKVDLVAPEEAERICWQLRLDAPQTQVWAADLRGHGAHDLARKVAPRLLVGSAVPLDSQVRADDGEHQAQAYSLTLGDDGLSLRRAQELLGGIIAALTDPDPDALLHVKLWGGDPQGGHALVSGATARDLSARGSSQGPLTGQAWLVVISHQPLPARLSDLVEQKLREAAPGALLEPLPPSPSLLSPDSLIQI